MGGSIEMTRVKGGGFGRVGGRGAEKMNSEDMKGQKSESAGGLNRRGQNGRQMAQDRGLAMPWLELE